MLIIGSGPVVIGQAAEFDYAGTQACRALRAEGVRTILVNSNPATIMTDADVADAVYLEPLTVSAIEAVIAREKPEGLLAGLGGQTALNLAMDLARAGVLERHDVKLLGTPLEAIRMAEDREAFRDLLDRIGQPYAPSAIVEGETADARQGSADAALAEIGLPAIVRPAFTLGGTGGGIVETEAAYRERIRAGLRASPIGQVMVERCLVGWQEIEYEVMRDADDTCIAVCSMENVDPLGVHTGDSIVVAPVQTLPDQVHQRLRSAALAIIRALGVEGGCNVQFALSPDSTDYAVIEVNPRVSRSSALASKATGYPIARVAAQIAIGRRLAEIPNVITGTTVAAFEPALDYVVVKLPRFPFDKFPGADRSLGSQMKATGEVMAIDRTFGSALNKALRGLEQAGAGPLAEDVAWAPTLGYLAAVLAGDPEDDAPIRYFDDAGEACESTRFAQRSAAPIVLRQFLLPSDSRLWRVLALLRRGVPEEAIQVATGIAPWFLAEMGRNVGLEGEIRGMGERIAGAGSAGAAVQPGAAAVPDPEAAALLATAKRFGFGDGDIANLASVPATAVRDARHALGLRPGYAMVDTCAAEFAAETPYFYATYAAAGSAPEAPPVARPAALVIGSGPVRIGQGIEFDYCAVKAAGTLRDLGWSAVMVNSNPETVSTDFDASTRLYFEPLDEESVESLIFAEGPEPLPAMVAYGGQTPLNLAAPLAAAGIELLGSDLEAIDQAEERVRFSALLDRLGIPQPEGGEARSVEEALTLAERIGYPVIVRPSFVIGGLAIDFCYSPEDLIRQLAAATVVDPDRPGPDRSVPRGRRGRRRRRVRRGARADPGPARARRAGGRPLRRLGRHVSAADRQRGGPGADRDDDAPRRARTRRARPRQRAVHRPRRRHLPDRGQPAGLANGAVHVEGHRRADGRSRRPDRARRHAGEPWLAGRPAPAAAVRRGQGAGLLDGEAEGRRPVRRAVHAVDRRGHRDPRGPAGRAREGAPGRVAAAAAAAPRAGRPAPDRARLDRRSRQAAAAAPRRGAGHRGLRDRRHGGHARHSRRARLRVRARREARLGRIRGGRDART